MFGADDLVYGYSRAQAIEDRVLVDVSELARQAGIRYPVAISQALWGEWIVPDDRARSFGQSEQGRLWDVLTLLAWATRKTSGSELRFPVTFVRGAGRRHLVQVKALCGPGDEGEPVLTIMLVGES